MRGAVAGLAMLSLCGPAFADRPLTDEERSRLSAAMKAQGCSGGQMEWDDDDGRFEIEDAICADGARYDLRFGPEYQFLAKRRDG